MLPSSQEEQSTRKDTLRQQLRFARQQLLTAQETKLRASKAIAWYTIENYIEQELSK